MTSVTIFLIGTDGRCGPNDGNNCSSCLALELRRTPICNNSHPMSIMVVSNYTCDRCRKTTSRDNLGTRRWRCPHCDYDLCFHCRPEECPRPFGYAGEDNIRMVLLLIILILSLLHCPQHRHPLLSLVRKAFRILLHFLSSLYLRC